MGHIAQHGSGSTGPELHVTMTLCEDDEEKQDRNMAFCLLHVYGGGSTEQESAFAVKFFSNENSEVFYSIYKIVIFKLPQARIICR